MGWYPLRRRLVRDGFDALILQYPNNGFCPIEESAKVGIETLNVIRNSYSHITFIGHSMGGLVGRYIAQVEQKTDLFDTFISLASPHQGTLMGKVGGWSDSAKQMCLNSDFMQKLNENPWPEHIETLSLQAAWELIVLPQKSAQFGSRNVKIPNCTHSTILVHPQTYGEIYSWLMYEVFQEVGFTFGPGISSKITPLIVRD